MSFPVISEPENDEEEEEAVEDSTVRMMGDAAEARPLPQG